MSKIFGERLKKLRNSNDMFQKDLASELDVAFNTISNWEHGLQEPSMDNVLKLCDILDTTPNYLLGYDDDESVATRDNPDTPSKRKNIVS